MAAMFLILLALVVSQGCEGSVIQLPDETHTHLTNPLIPKTIGIAKSFLDTQVSCGVIFPNGVLYEAYPEDKLPHETITYLYSVQPFTGCSIGFRNSPPSLSGTYELISVVRHSDSSETTTRQRFHLTFQEIDPWHAKVEDQPQDA